AAFIDLARGSQDLSIFELFLPPTNLPAQTTPLIGRERDVSHLCERLLRDDTRLITLVGPPGIGKTRLSLQVAADVRDRFDDGVFFVPLAPVTEFEFVAPAIARALKIRESSPVEPLDRLNLFLRYKSILLVLDNFEQLVDASPIASQLLAACPRLRLLITSRMPLSIRAERQYSVPPLDLPDITELPPVGELLQYSAIALFVDRAEAVRPNFVITEENAADVAALCGRLDGLPLAIELISARIKIMQPSELLSRLGSSILLQSDGLRDVDERQRTLSKAIEWSYNLLDPAEQLLFVHLGVFVGGWTLEAAESLHGPIRLSSDSTTVEILNSLVNKGLVMQQYWNDESRFEMLEMIREYSLGQIILRGEEDAARRDHTAYYRSQIEKASPRLYGSVKLINQIEREHSNLREALRWSIERGEVETAYRLVVATAMLWSIHNWHLGEGREWLSRVLALEEVTKLEPKALADLHQQAGVLAYLQNDYEIAREHHQQALFYARKSKNMASIGHALFGLSNAAMNQEEYEEVLVLLGECLPLARETGDKWLEAMALNNLAEVARLEEDFEKVELMFREGLELLEWLGDKLFKAILLDGLGTLTQYQGDYTQASEIHTRCLLLSREMGDRRIISLTLEKLSGVAAGQGRAKRAARLLGAAEALRETIHAPVESIDRSDYELFVSMTRAGLDEDKFVDCWAEGRTLGQERAIAYALEGAVKRSLN
ncbi:MAG: NB-ARC domain-containing protein, partial [Candidatus Promineifilaceae bacterium]